MSDDDVNRFKEMNKMKYLAVGVLTIIIFSAGIFLGNYFSQQKVEELQDIEEDLRLQTLGAEVQYQILITNPCQFINSTPLTEELYDLSNKLDHLENIYGEDDERVLKLKERYSLLEVKHWLFVRKTNERCRTDLTPILYFYSNKGDCDKCDEQGYVLTYLRRKYDDLRVYSFDINMDNPAMNTIKEIYDVESAPTVIVGDNLVYPNYISRTELEDVIRERMRNATSNKTS